MITIDALGQPCPIPVVKARKAIAELPENGGVVRVLVDNTVACENLAKMADGGGYSHTTEHFPDGTYAFTITVGTASAPPAPVPAPDEPTAFAVSGGNGGLVVAVGCNSMGRGSEELGKILIKGFIFSLAQLEIPPKAMVFFNSGIDLVTEGANTLGDLQELEAKGTTIQVCGTCLDYYGRRDKVAVGTVVNMYDITQTVDDAGKLMNL